MNALRLSITGLLLTAASTALQAADDKPTHQEVDPIQFDIGEEGHLKTIAMDRNGNLLAGISFVPPGETDYQFAVRTVSPEGRVIDTWPMEDGLRPGMIHGCDNGLVYVAGGGKLAAFSEKGELHKMIDTDEVSGSQSVASGLFVSDKHVFLALGMGNSMRATEDIWRFQLDLSEPKQIIERLYGCCSHIDLEVINDQLLIGENSRHRVNVYDLDGNQLDTWGQRDRVSIEGFAACCNPCNTDIGPDGLIYTAESGVGRVKKYKPDGTFLGVVGFVDTTVFDQGSRLAAQSCYIPVEVNHDASRIYVLDVRTHFVRVLEKL